MRCRINTQAQDKPEVVWQAGGTKNKKNGEEKTGIVVVSTQGQAKAIHVKPPPGYQSS